MPVLKTTHILKFENVSFWTGTVLILVGLPHYREETFIVIKLIIKTSANIGTDKEGLKDIMRINNLSFEEITKRFQVDLKWNSLIFQLYKNRISINLVEIDEQLKLIQDKKEIEEYLISEIVINTVTKDKLESVIEKTSINIEENKKIALRNIKNDIEVIVSLAVNKITGDQMDNKSVTDEINQIDFNSKDLN